MKLSKLLLAVVGATVLLGALVSSASARNISVSNQNLRAQFREVVFRGLFGSTNCQVTLEGSLHSRTIVKRLGALIGYITRATLGPCRTGTATILNATLPWHVTYQGFTGTLPNIVTIITHNIGASFNIRTPEGFTCLSTSTTGEPAVGTYNREVAGRVLTTASIGGTIETSCGIPGTFNSDNGPVTLLGATTRITVTLI